MNELPRPAQVYIWLIFGLGLAAAFASLIVLPVEPTTVLIVIALAIIIAALDHYPVTLYSSQKNGAVEITISVAVKIAAILLLPPPFVIVAVFGGTVLAELWLRRVWYKVLFNVGMMTVEFTVVAALYNSIHDPSVPLLGSVQNILALVALGLGDVLLNGFLVSMIIALATQSPIRYVWAQNYKPLILHDLSMLPIGVFIYILWQFSPWSVILAALPLILMRQSYHLVAELRRQTRGALYALARVLDERDVHTSQHSDKVSEHSGLIARELGLDLDQVDEIMLAAAMHDIGKIGMRNDILFKPGTLTDQERELAKRHADIGGDLLQKFPMFENGAAYVRHHHERWDGTGYPDKLQGEAIPLGARIIAVADSYQAMTEQRPYRAPLSEEAALQELRNGAGTQFDPNVVEAFFRVKGLASVTTDAPALIPAPTAVSLAEST
ncbi:MAG: HD-GYP domain-containing protein [Chloroflexota bacterium]|nr:MAG: HD-GYP domain-containing protein [Chloroflexota bacterium]